MRKISNLSDDWNNEAYVSLHLVQTILKQAGIAQRGWHPEFRIREAGSHVFADFRIEDVDRHVEFLIEVKSAKSPIDNAARFQLQSSYLFHSKIRYGFLIDPFNIEVYEFAHGKAQQRAQHAIAHCEIR
jgi:chromosome partitioning protein